jgi:hypothetical protein
MKDIQINEAYKEVTPDLAGNPISWLPAKSEVVSPMQQKKT